MKSELSTEKSLEPASRCAVVAAAFSPRALAVLNESQQLLSMLKMTPIIVHVGESSADNSTRLEKTIAESYFSTNSDVKLELRDGDPEAVLLAAARDHHADLIIAGALPRESIFKLYMGSVGRNLARLAPCSVLLYANPNDEPKGIRKIHHAVEYHKSKDVGVDLSAQFAALTGARDLYYTHAFHIPESYTKKKKEIAPEDYKKIYTQQDLKLEKYLAKQVAWDVAYHAQSLHDRDHFPSLAFARDISADLFVINAPKKMTGLWNRLFPDDLEQTLQELPCSILIARKSVYRGRKS
jgi:nucleotide-binding universal stress UspA family protein